MSLPPPGSHKKPVFIGSQLQRVRFYLLYRPPHGPQFGPPFGPTFCPPFDPPLFLAIRPPFTFPGPRFPGRP